MRTSSCSIVLTLLSSFPGETESFQKSSLVVRHHHHHIVRNRHIASAKDWTASSQTLAIPPPRVTCQKTQQQQHHPVKTTTTTLAATPDSSSASNADDSTTKKFDFDAVFKYTAAIAIQMSLLFGLLRGLDAIVSRFSLQVPFAVNVAFFYALALKSRVFNPLANNRPSAQTLETSTAKEKENKRKMPTWTPPGVIFPIMWLLIIAPIRAVSSSMIYASTKCYANPALLALMLHLSIGDVWNTINNIEMRYGVSVVGVLCVWLSKAFAAYKYFEVVPLAGKLLALPLIWLSVASALIAATWRLNPDPNTGKPEPLYPIVGNKKTTFFWFGKL